MFVYDDVVYAQTWQVLILKNCMEPFSCASSAYVVASALVSVRLFWKNLGKLQKFFGQMVYRPTPPPPPHPLAKIARTPMFIINFCTCSMYFCCFVLVYSNSRHVVWMILWTVDKTWHETVGRVGRPVGKIMTLFQTSKMSFSTSVFRSGPRCSKGPVTFRVHRPIFKIKTIIT